MRHLNNRVPADIYLCLQPQAARAKWSPNVWLLLGRRRRQWPDIKTALVRCLLFFAFRKRTTKHLLLVYRTSPLNPYSSEIYICKPWRTKVFFKFENIILVCFFRFTWIPVLWVDGDYKYFHSHSAGIDFRRQNLTSYRRQILTSNIVPRTVKVNGACDVIPNRLQWRIFSSKVVFVILL